MDFRQKFKNKNVSVAFTVVAKGRGGLENFYLEIPAGENFKKNKPNKNYKSKNHSKFILTYHIIFVCKYRKKLLIKYGEDVKQIMYDISKRYDFEIKEMEVDKDHIHYMIETTPNINLSNMVKTMKSYITYHIWEKYSAYLSKCFWKERTFFSDGYFISSIGNVSQETLKNYIENQGK